MKTPKGLEGCVASPAVWFHIAELEEERNRLKAERDQAVEDLRYIGKLRENNCTFCLYYNHGDGSKECIRCGKFGEDHWQWRGVPEKEE